MGRRLSFGMVVTTMVVVLATRPLPAQPVWTVVHSPNVAGSDYNELDGVASVSGTEAWAVGFARAKYPAPFRALIEHWNGTAWQIVPSAPITTSDDTRLHAAAAVSPTDVWAVGGDASSSFNSVHSLAEHWNGKAWTIVPRPTKEPAESNLDALAVVSASDIWAVGYANGNTLAEHWNGKAWTVVPDAPLPSTRFNALFGVAAASTNDVWAVGRMFRHSTPVIEHWDGRSWTQVSQPVGGYDSSLTSIAVIASNDIWAVGSQNLSETVTEHWDGHHWSLVPSPFPTTDNAQNFLEGVAAFGSSDVWAAGISFQNFANQSLTEHWDGHQWNLVPSPNVLNGSDQLAGVAGSKAGQTLWAVGSAPGQTYRTFIITTTA